VIRAGDRVSAVLARDERLVEVFTSLSPTFERLRKPAMRKVMARLVTIEQAARMAGIEPALLIGKLNEALGEEGAADLPGTKSNAGLSAEKWGEAVGVGGVQMEELEGKGMGKGKGKGGSMVVGESEVPAALAAVPVELIVDIDVRPDLRRGEEPFSKIMAARREVRPGGVLRLRATFEPVPLYAVLGKQGMEHWTERFADDDWRVWFYTPGAPSSNAQDAPAIAARPISEEVTASPAAPAGAAGDPEDDVVILDVRGLEPPEPMMRTFEALEQLPRGKTLLQLNVRVPQFLLPQLAARGFTYEVREQSADLVRIFIRHAAAEE
jgi:uncharacterized protein (DUF2249 family)